MAPISEPQSPCVLILRHLREIHQGPVLAAMVEDAVVVAEAEAASAVVEAAAVEDTVADEVVAVGVTVEGAVVVEATVVGMEAAEEDTVEATVAAVAATSGAGVLTNSSSSFRIGVPFLSSLSIFGSIYAI